MEKNEFAIRVKQTTNPKLQNVIICVTGSVATIKLPILAEKLKQFFNIVIVVTESVKIIRFVVKTFLG